MKKINKPKLSEDQKILIDRYLFKKMIWIATAASIVSFLLGFFINDIAKSGAYNKAYSEAAQTIIQITRKASESAIEIKHREEQIAVLLKEAERMKEQINTTLVIQQSENIVSSVVDNLLKSQSFVDKVVNRSDLRISDLERKTKNISIDNSGKMIIDSDLRIFGIVQAEESYRMGKQ